jgi:F-type H+-transporting ATPase subunit a
VSTSALVASDSGCHLVPWSGQSDCGFPAPDTTIFDYQSLWEFTVAGITFHVTKPMLLVVLVAATVIIWFVLAFRKAKIVPRGIQNVSEYGYLFVRDGIARDTIGKEGDKFVPLLFSFFFFIWLLNFLGVLPFAQVPSTARFAIPVAFALLVYILWVPLGVKRQGAGAFFKGMTMPKDVPVAMYVLLIPIEILSNFIVRPFTHAVRLFANMFAGHLLIVTFSVAAWYLLSPSVIGVIGSAASFTVTVGLTGFEMLIQALQAYVFTLLAAVYINDAVNAH